MFTKYLIILDNFLKVIKCELSTSNLHFQRTAFTSTYFKFVTRLLLYGNTSIHKYAYLFV